MDHNNTKIKEKKTIPRIIQVIILEKGGFHKHS